MCFNWLLNVFSSDFVELYVEGEKDDSKTHLNVNY